MMTHKPKPLVIERTLQASAAKVWQALTDRQQLKEWLPFMAEFEPVVGHELRFKLGKDPEHQYEHVSKVIEVVDERKLTYGWRYEGYPGNSQVSFELFPEGNATRLRLTHEITEPFPADNSDFAQKNFAEGWTYTASGLQNFVENN